MKRILVVAFALLAFAPPATLAQGTTTTVKYSLTADQPSLFDNSLRDNYIGVIDDDTGITTLKINCSAGASGFLGMGRVDETCAVSGDGDIRNPNNLQQTLDRINYSGGFTIEAQKDGYTDMTSLKAEYLRAGSAGAESTSFNGAVTMMPENPSASASQLADRLFASIKEKATGVDAVDFDTQIDSIRFDNFVIPHVGGRDSSSCSWSNDAIYAYVNASWQMALNINCNGTVYELEGNMALVDTPTAEHDHEYRLNLVVPGVGGGDPFAAADPFATVSGITAVLKMTDSGRKTEDGVAEKIVVSGEFIGTDLPSEVVRGFPQIMTIFARTFYGE